MHPTGRNNNDAASLPQQHQQQSQYEEEEEDEHVVIVGAGMAGLACAQRLLLSNRKNRNKDNNLRVTILEASNQAGGRIRVDNSLVPDLDLGAEFIHGQGHLLWKEWETMLNHHNKVHESNTIQEEEFETKNKKEQQQPPQSQEQYGESIFILSHADGGPDTEPTPEGKYGMFFVHGALKAYNDPTLQPLTKAIKTVMERGQQHNNDYDASISMQEAILAASSSSSLPLELQDLAIAGFGNTAGCCDLSKLSVSQCVRFQEYWEANEIEGDCRPHGGMYRIVQYLLDKLLKKGENEGVVELKLNRPIQRIRRRKCTEKYTGKHDRVELVCVNGEKYTASRVVVTTPPKLWTNLFDDNDDDDDDKFVLPEPKRRAIQHVGMERAIKIICKFRQRLWPEQVQSVIATNDQPIPELWFRDVVAPAPSSSSSSGNNNTTTYHLAVGFLMSTAADNLLNAIASGGKNGDNCVSQKQDKAAEVLLTQLSTMFSISRDRLQDALLGSVFYDWMEDPYIQGGYMYPKVHMTEADFHALAAPVENKLYFAGEATNTNACCTVQAAMETGVRAANQILASYTQRQ